MKALDKDFYRRDTALVARELVGKNLYKRINGEWVGGMIVETEAYLHEIDEASHSFRGMTKRNEAMYMDGGVSYVYFIYGNHFCFNIVTEIQGRGTAVLIRALEPLSGIETMQRNRGTEDLRKLCSGPGKLCQALGIAREDNAKDLCESDIMVTAGRLVEDKDIHTAGRVGIRLGRELELRYYLKKSAFVSKK